MGFLMVGLPGVGFALGIVLLCVRPLRFLAPFSFLIPLLSSYGGLAGFWEGGCAFEALGLGEPINSVVAVAAGLVGSTLGAALGAGGGAAVLGLVRRLRHRGVQEGSYSHMGRVSSWEWWGSRRRHYNLVMLVAAFSATCCYLLVDWAGSRLMGQAQGESSFLREAVPTVAVYLVAVGLANVWYLAGPLSERIVRPADLDRYRRITLRLACWFSVLLFLAYPGVMAGAALLCAVAG
jgi:hypothetical protein